MWNFLFPRKAVIKLMWCTGCCAKETHSSDCVIWDASTASYGSYSTFSPETHFSTSMLGMWFRSEHLIISLWWIPALSLWSSKLGILVWIWLNAQPSALQTLWNCQTQFYLWASFQGIWSQLCSDSQRGLFPDLQMRHIAYRKESTVLHMYMNPSTVWTFCFLTLPLWSINPTTVKHL